MSKIEVKIPPIGESVTEVTLASWLVQDGDYVKLDQPLAEFESDKATFELPAEAAGVFTRDPKATEGADMKIGDVIGSIDTAAAAPAKEAPKAPAKQEAAVEAPKPVAPPAEAKAEPAPAATSYATGTPSPAAKKILEEKNIPAAEVSGSGPGGRITKDDALKAETKPAAPQQAPAKEKITYERPAGNFSREERVEKMTRIRKTISRRLVQVKNETAMLTTFNEVDMTRINQIRDQYKKSFEEQHGIGLGFMSFFTKACTVALQKYPAINAYIDEENIIYHDYCDISIAVSTPKGLVVPVIRNAESLSFAEIEKEVTRLALKGRDGELTLEDMDGGTFTITNGGVFGSLMSTPIINQPQSAILGMHKVQDRPMAINGKVEIRPMMYVALSYDHRIVDGKESVGFLVTVKDMLENPEKMLFGADPVRQLLNI